jgi:uridine phosphorylase
MSDPFDPNANAHTHPFTAAELPLDEQGRIYHLQVKPEQVAPDILIVGDPGRARFISQEFLREVELEHEHRGLVTVTGIAASTGLRTTVTTSGMGSPSLEIVVSELVALNEIDLATRTRKTAFPRLHIIRVGTSGALQASTTLGTAIITTYAAGLDNSGLYYAAPYADETCRRLEKDLAQALAAAMPDSARFRGAIHPYVARADPLIVKALAEAAASLGVRARQGLTASGAGFFAPQGRDIARVPPAVPGIDRLLSEFDPQVGRQRFENMEMETSLLLHYLGGLGHRAGAICAAIANRRENTFDPQYQESICGAVKVALLALGIARKG